MKDSLTKLIEKTILLECSLPNTESDIDRTCVTTLTVEDDCFKAENTKDLAKIIYEGILYYSYDEFQLKGSNHQKMFLKAFNNKFKYNYSASELAKRKLGIYGESLLYAILKHFYKTDTLISRGYFYDIQKKTEVTGYDAFHLIQRKDNIELWFGETKFYEDCKSAINSVFKSIEKAISDEYLVNTNFTTILQHKGDIVDKTSKLYSILDKWDKCIIESLEKELIDNDISLIYPVLVTYNSISETYTDSIKLAVEHIKENFSHISFDKISVEFSIFFIFLPIEDVKATKETIIKWIDTKEPLMS